MESIPQDTPMKHCPRCNCDLPATSEYWHRARRNKDGWRLPCKSCRHNEVVDMVARDPDIWKKNHQRNRKNELAKPIEEREKLRSRRAQNVRNLRTKRKQPGVCSVCQIRPVEPGHLCEQCRSRFAHWTENNRDKVHAIQKNVRNKLRDEVLYAYGGKCTCCGEIRAEFLAVDHVNRDGNHHRRALRSQGTTLYRWLRKNHFPQDGRFQLLCHNCNHAKHVYGVCPHKNEAP